MTYVDRRTIIRLNLNISSSSFGKCTYIKDSEVHEVLLMYEAWNDGDLINFKVIER